MKTFKRFLASMLCVVVVLTAAPLSGFVGLKFPEINLPKLFDFGVEAETATYGRYSYNVSNGEATITDCDIDTRGSIVIPSTLGGYPVTRIGEKAFYSCTKLTSISIPDGVTSIGEKAFYDCESLESITIPDSVTSISGDAFRYAGSNTASNTIKNVYYIGDIESWCGIEFGSSYSNPGSVNFYINDMVVTDIVIPETVTEIKEYTFSGFEGITSVTIPDSVTTIGYSAFYECSELKYIYYTGDIE